MNDRIRNLLIQYDFSKSSDPYVYWSTHISNLLYRSVAPKTTDISLVSGSSSFELHKFLLSSRTPYFQAKLDAQPETTIWKLASGIPSQAFNIAVRYLYLGDIPKDIVPSGSSEQEEEVLIALDKISKDLQIEHLWVAILAGNDRRLARQRQQDEVERALEQVSKFFEKNVLGHKMIVNTESVDKVKWKRDNSIFADILLRADEHSLEDEALETSSTPEMTGATIPIGSSFTESQPQAIPQQSTLYPAHKAMLIRSEYFERMFGSPFLESQDGDHLHIVKVDCTPPVLELILAFLYTENISIPLEHALELLYAADMLFLDPLKTKAAQAISTLGSGTKTIHIESGLSTNQNTKDVSSFKETNDDRVMEMEPVNVYDVVHAAWDLRVQRLEEFGARYLADRLEDYIDEKEFSDLIEESASRLVARQETDTIELLDDIRYYLDERFKMRFEDAGLVETMDEEAQLAGAVDENGVPVGENVDAEAAGETNEEKVEDEDSDDEFVNEAVKYRGLLEKIDDMLARLNLEA